jgi:hypothetical protein
MTGSMSAIAANRRAVARIEKAGASYPAIEALRSSPWWRRVVGAPTCSGAHRGPSQGCLRPPHDLAGLWRRGAFLKEEPARARNRCGDGRRYARVRGAGMAVTGIDFSESDVARAGRQGQRSATKDFVIPEKRSRRIVASGK